MKRIIFFLLASTIAFTSCNRQPKTADEGTANQVVAADTIKTEADLLLEYLAQQGDYVNGRQFPSMIKIPTVYENLGKNMLVIDCRKPETYSKGHIKGAVNVSFNSLPSYFEKDIKPFQYEKIVLVCDHGQRSSYATCLLRLMGYGNVYSMRWGMAAWNKGIARESGWDKICSDKFASQLDTVTIGKPAALAFPNLKTGKKTGEEIFKERIKALFAEDLKYVMLPAEMVFGGKDSLFLINLDRKDKYESGHIPGAVRYKPNGTLGIASEMKTIPADKPVVVYCETGHNSGFATAYLRLFGYKAHSLKMGNNSFMYGKMLRETELGWNTFNEEEQHDYPLVK
jgi:rhodanese-related sulfurtransferase